MRAQVEPGPVVNGASLGAAVLVLTALIANLSGVLDDDERLAFAFPLLLLALTGLGAAGWVAAQRCRRAPLIHAAAAAVAAVVVVGAVGVVRQAVAGDEIVWASAGLWLLLGLAGGLLGGLSALRPRRKADSPG